jgi:hypothetical protein
LVRFSDFSHFGSRQAPFLCSGTVCRLLPFGALAPWLRQARARFAGPRPLRPTHLCCGAYLSGPGFVD